MKALRLILKQNKAHFCKESSYKNRMTNPLPFPSTIIGTIHNICNWNEYVPMDISIQGKFDCIAKEMHNLTCFFDSIQDDRGILVKMCSPNVIYSKFQVVSKSLKTQGNSHIKEITTEVVNRKLLEEYKTLKLTKEKLKEDEKKELGDRPNLLKEIKTKKKQIKDKKSKEFLDLTEQEKRISLEEKSIKQKYKDLTIENDNQLSLFRVMTNIPQYYEVIHNLNLVIYIKTEDETKLNEIIDNIYDLEHLGRTEDSVDIIDASIVELENPSEKTLSYQDYIAYIPYKFIKDKDIRTLSKKGINLGTVYYANKNYEIIDNKRIFNKEKVLLVSNYTTNAQSINTYVDTLNNESIIVSFI